MHLFDTTPRAKRKATSRPDLFGWARDAELLHIPAVRRIARANISPVLALTISELSGLLREAR